MACCDAVGALWLVADLVEVFRLNPQCVTLYLSCST